MKRFITFEGIDGSGKSTVAQEVYKRLDSEGVKVILTFEPTDSEIGQYVQKCIKTDSDPFVTAFAFIADRLQHCQQIQQWLDEENTVICDRYAESTYAYQGAQLEKHMKNPMRWLRELSEGRILVPDRTFLFVVDPETSLKRIQHRETLVPFEKVAFLEKVQTNYLKLATGKRFLTIDATKTKEEIIMQCYQDIVS